MNTLSAIQALYDGIPKPEQFGNPGHCTECAEHNQTLQTHDIETISFAELGNPGWDPICFISDIHQFRYYLPALARLACAQGDKYYLGQFLFHLNEDRIRMLTAEERILLANFLEELMEKIPEEIELNLDTDDVINCAIRLRSIGDDLQR